MNSRILLFYFLWISITLSAQEAVRGIVTDAESRYLTIHLVSHRMPNRSQAWSINGTLSRGFYDCGVKTSFSYLFGRNEGEQLSAGQRLPYRSDYMQVEPKIIWTPFRRPLSQ